jgi:cysteine sulfinate desulfinase/cysteine desulfurase-like protein
MFGDDARTTAGVRVSLGEDTSERDVEDAIEAFGRVIRRTG